jgi:HSP20 family protein
MEASMMRDLASWARPRSIARRDAMDPFMAFQRDMNRLMEETFGNFVPAALTGGFGPSFPGGSWPSLSVSETDSAYVVKAEVPGMDAKDVDLSLTDDALTIRGEKKTHTENAQTHVSEHYEGQFERRLPIGNDIDRDHIEASFDKGVLTITLPKKPGTAAGAKRIAIAESGKAA